MRDINPIFLISSGGGSGCIEGWDGITRDGDGFAIGSGSGD